MFTKFANQQESGEAEFSNPIHRKDLRALERFKSAAAREQQQHQAYQNEDKREIKRPEDFPPLGGNSNCLSDDYYNVWTQSPTQKMHATPIAESIHKRERSSPMSSLIRGMNPKRHYARRQMRLTSVHSRIEYFCKSGTGREGPGLRS